MRTRFYMTNSRMGWPLAKAIILAFWISGCVDNTNCEAGSECIGHQCRPVETCTDDASCNNGEATPICDIANSPYTTCFYCEGGECKPGGFKSDQDSWPSCASKNNPPSQDASQMPTAPVVTTAARIIFASTPMERFLSSRSLSEQRLAAPTALRRV